MLYDLRRDIDKERFQTRAEFLLRKGAAVELTEKAARITSQNSYIHLIIGLVALETGVSAEYAKTEYFKRLVNPDIFVIKVQDQFAGEVQVLKSSALLSKEEMSTAIDRFKKWAAAEGMYIPEPGDEQRLRELEIELARQNRWI